MSKTGITDMCKHETQETATGLSLTTFQWKQAYTNIYQKLT